MKQGLLNALWHLNRRAVRINLPLPGIACMADSFEQQHPDLVAHAAPVR